MALSTWSSTCSRVQCSSITRSATSARQSTPSKRSLPKFPPRACPPVRPGFAGLHPPAARLLDHHRKRRDQFRDGDRQVEEFIARQLRMRAAQSVPEHFSQRRQAFAGKIIDADGRQLRYIIGDGEDLPQ